MNGAPLGDDYYMTVVAGNMKYRMPFMFHGTVEIPRVPTKNPGLVRK